MSGLWGSDDIEIPASGEFSSGGGDFDVIPAKTKVLFQIEDVKIEEPNENEPNEYINIRWVILKPDEYENRKIFQKIRVFSEDKEKRRKARTMLAVIDVNANGNLTKFAEKHKVTLEELTSDNLSFCLVGKTMSGTLMVWDLNGKVGNWVQSIAPANGAKVPFGSKPATPTTSKSYANKDDDTDIPW